ncbi:MAG: hypothetical protein AAFP93_01520 [Bacteroidota bacterium]
MNTIKKLYLTTIVVELGALLMCCDPGNPDTRKPKEDNIKSVDTDAKQEKSENKVRPVGNDDRKEKPEAKIRPVGNDDRHKKPGVKVRPFGNDDRKEKPKAKVDKSLPSTPPKPTPSSNHPMPLVNQNSAAVQELQREILRKLGDNDSLKKEINSKLKDNLKSYLRDITEFCRWKRRIQLSDIETILTGVEKAIDAVSDDSRVSKATRSSLNLVTRVGRVRSISGVFNIVPQLRRLGKQLITLKIALQKQKKNKRRLLATS